MNVGPFTFSVKLNNTNYFKTSKSGADNADNDKRSKNCITVASAPLFCDYGVLKPRKGFQKLKPKQI